MRLIFRRLRGAVGTALAWAAAWFGAGFLFITAINVFQLGIFRHYTTFSLWNALEYATTMATVGFVTGGAFSLYVIATFRDKRLEDINPARFALGGGLVAVLLSLGLLGVVSGFEVFLLQDLFWPIALPAFLGSVTGYSSIRMARKALPPAKATAGQLDSGSDGLLPEREEEAV